MLAAALSCDLTRVATLFYGIETGGPSFDWLLENPENYHSLSHAGRGTREFDDYTRCRTWYAEQFASLLDKLAAVPEGNGTLLDNCTVLFTSAMGYSQGHANYSIPTILAGRGGGFLSAGRRVTYGNFDPGRPHDAHGGRDNNGLLVTLCHAMGLTDVTTFGDPSYDQSLLSEIIA